MTFPIIIRVIIAWLHLHLQHTIHRPIKIDATEKQQTYWWFVVRKETIRKRRNKMRNEMRKETNQLHRNQMHWVNSIKKLKQLKLFFTKIRLTVSLTKAPTCQSKRFGEREGEIGFINVFHQNLNTFHTSNFLYSPLIPAYYFSLAYIFTFLSTCIHP